MKESELDKITYQDIVDAVKLLEENNQPGPDVMIMPPDLWAKEFRGWVGEQMGNAIDRQIMGELADEIPVVRDSNPST